MVSVRACLALAWIFHSLIENPPVARVRARGLHAPNHSPCRPRALTRRSTWEIFGLGVPFAFSFAFALGLGLPLRAASPAEGNLDQWLAAQTNVHTWSADVVQTRTLKALTTPLLAQGKVWFREPNFFRWELGSPPQTIAVRQPEQMLVIYPNLRRLEKYPLTGNQLGPMRDALTLFEAGFPRSRADIDSKFKIASQTESNGVYLLQLEPKSTAARRIMPMIRIGFSTQNYGLQMTELQFADESSLRTDFTNSVINGPIDQKIFTPEVSADFKVIEPMRRP